MTKQLELIRAGSIIREADLGGMAGDKLESNVEIGMEMELIFRG